MTVNIQLGLDLGPHLEVRAVHSTRPALAVQRGSPFFRKFMEIGKCSRVSSPPHV